MLRNQVQVVGNVGKAPERTAQTKDGRPVVRFAIAQDVNGMDQTTQKLVKRDPQWFQVSCFAGLAERTLDALVKGDLVVIVGELKSKSYQTQSGEKRTSTEIVANEIFKLERLRKSSEQDPFASHEDVSLCPDFESFGSGASL